MTLLQLAEMFPDEDAARKWFADIVWPDGTRYCLGCGSDNTHECKHPKMPYRCRDCKKYFSIKTGIVMAKSPIRHLHLKMTDSNDNPIDPVESPAAGGESEMMLAGFSFGSSDQEHCAEE